MGKTKVCSKCGIKKAVEEFYVCKRNKDGLRSQCKKCMLKYKKDNKERENKRDREYSRWYRNTIGENKEKKKIRNQRRRSKAKKLESTLTPEQWTRIKKDFNNSCAYCGMTEEEHLKQFGEQLHQEHFIPLSEGGGYTGNNIIPACKTCNSSKGDKEFREWYYEQSFYSKHQEENIFKYISSIKQ